MDPRGDRDIAFLDVKDSHNLSATILDCIGLICTNSGNNTNWRFVALAPVTGSVAGQANNLIAMGNYEAALQLMEQWPHLFTQEERQLLQEKLQEAKLPDEEPPVVDPLELTQEQLRQQLRELQLQVIALLEQLVGRLQDQLLQMLEEQAAQQ